jgi:MraZ protein
MDVFIGTIQAKKDAKGRVCVPATFRRILQTAGESRLILRRDVHKDCLILYPESIWKEDLSKLRAQLNVWDEAEEELFRDLSSFVEEVEIDSYGRILIPKQYLQMAIISNTITFVGMYQNIELWNPDLFIKSRLGKDDLKSRVKKFLGSKKTDEKNE